MIVFREDDPPFGLARFKEKRPPPKTFESTRSSDIASGAEARRGRPSSCSVEENSHLPSLIAKCRKFGKALCALGVVNAVLGNKQDAIREGQLAVELMPVSKSVEGSLLIEYLAVIDAWTGDKDRAIERLNEAVKLPGERSELRPLRLNLIWDPLRGDPRFDAIIASPAPK